MAEDDFKSRLFLICKNVSTVIKISIVHKRDIAAHSQGINQENKENGLHTKHRNISMNGVQLLESRNQEREKSMSFIRFQWKCATFCK